MSSLPCSAVAASASHILVDQRFRLSLLQQWGCCWQSSWRRASGPGQQDSVGLEMVDAALEWVILCSTCRFAALQVCSPAGLSLSPGLREAGRLHLAAVGLSNSFATLLKLIARKGWWWFLRDGLSFQPYFLLLMVVIAGSLLSRSIHTQFPHVAIFPKDQTWVCAAVYRRRDIKSINGALHSCKFSHSVIFPSRQERCENHVDSEAEVHGKTGNLLITATDDGPFWNCVSGRFY